MAVNVSYAGKPPAFAKGFPIAIPVTPETTVGGVKSSIAAAFPKFYTSRQKIALNTDKKALSDDTKISALNGELTVKDLGPQIGWKTVFLIEYAGPLVVHPIFYHFSKTIYGQEVPHSDLQKLIYGMVMVHFVKRELETMFIHRFSHGTMPFFNVFKNSFHYHVLSGLFLAADIYRPKFSLTSDYIIGTYRENPQVLQIAAGVWVWAQLSNFWTHWTLRNLRPAGTTKRAIPYGYGFSAPFNVSCPNYLFDIIAWSVIAGLSGSYAAVFFLTVAIAQMMVWAKKKHSNYKKEFGKEFPRGRKILFPFVF
ncbi:3-oxo-5-alpha-steroid 4-dehydrogenase-domain-containing protein [Flagelloscypha sp. PMI_526]|nr:3-oxo-5-alpha-steroid 4-dehydrogenase-domain-containing protein [Flagelloscypha sp. PMI_526]